MRIAIFLTAWSRFMYIKTTEIWVATRNMHKDEGSPLLLSGKLFVLLFLVIWSSGVQTWMQVSC